MNNKRLLFFYIYSYYIIIYYYILIQSNKIYYLLNIFTILSILFNKNKNFISIPTNICIQGKEELQTRRYGFDPRSMNN